MTDDHSAQAISCYGSKVNQTPNLDRLAKEGMRMDRVFATNSICTPSRATILTGKYSHMNGVPVFNRFDGSQPTVQKMLQQAGYYTAMIGKWHLGSNPIGFDYWNILPGQGVYNDPTLYDKDGSAVYQGYATDIITDLTIDALKNRPKDKPFFIMSHHKAPHREWTPDEKHRKQFEGKHIPEPVTLRDDYSGRTDALHEQQQSVFRDLTRRDLKIPPPPELSGTRVAAMAGGEAHRSRNRSGRGQEETDRQRTGQTGSTSAICRTTWPACKAWTTMWADCWIGSMRTDSGKTRVVIYTSDQGFFLGEHGLFDKRFMYEESLRMPFLVRWPGVSGRAALRVRSASTATLPRHSWTSPGSPRRRICRAAVFSRCWKEKTPRNWRHAMYYRYYHDPGDHNTRAHYGVRTETHKLIYFWKKDQWECYDLVADPEEMHNIYDDPRRRRRWRC